MKKILLLIVFSISNVLAWADNVRFTAEGPDVVVKGQQFQVAYTVNSQKVKEFRAPEFSDFEELYGPSRSTSMNMNSINGKMTTTHTTTWTYMLQATKEGTFTIPAATVKAGDEQYASNTLTIKVLPPDQDSQSQGGGQGGRQSASRASSGGKITDSDLFMNVTASKTTLYEQEALLLTYKVYTLVNLVALDNPMPDFQGFHTQEVELPQRKTFSMEHYKGRNYNTLTWRQYVLFPQKSGELEIPSMSFDSTIEQMVENQNPFDDPFGLDAFFNGSRTVQVKKTLVTPAMKIRVKELPSGKPASFSGAVGDFSITSSISAQQLKANEALTLKLVISGVGNMKLVNAPDVQFPADFDAYDPKTDNQLQLTNAGQSGNKTVEYLAIPRHPGDFTIPSVEFSYFDTKTSQYKTVATEAYNIHVEKGEGGGNADAAIANFTNKEDLKLLGSDIRYIKTGEVSLLPKGDFLFGTLGYWLWYVIPFVLLVMVLAFYRKQALENANVTKVKTKKANKVATRRMKNAEKLMRSGNNAAFYDEVLKALWGYMGDKLSIPVSQLSKDNIEEKLAARNVGDALIREFIGTLNECEFARYAPGSQSEAMDKVYTSAVDVIGNLENSIKH